MRLAMTSCICQHFIHGKVQTSGIDFLQTSIFIYVQMSKVCQPPELMSTSYIPSLICKMARVISEFQITTRHMTITSLNDRFLFLISAAPRHFR